MAAPIMKSSGGEGLNLTGTTPGFEIHHSLMLTEAQVWQMTWGLREVHHGSEISRWQMLEGNFTDRPVCSKGQAFIFLPAARTVVMAEDLLTKTSPRARRYADLGEWSGLIVEAFTMWKWYKAIYTKYRKQERQNLRRNFLTL